MLSAIRNGVIRCALGCSSIIRAQVSRAYRNVAAEVIRVNRDAHKYTSARYNDEARRPLSAPVVVGAIQTRKINLTRVYPRVREAR